MTTSTGQVLTSQDPVDPTPTWTAEAPVPGATAHSSAGSLTCPSAGFCAVIMGAFLTTTDPAGGASTWTAHPLTGVASVACASTSLCAAFGNGAVLTSTDPTDPSPTWSTTALPATPNAATQAACPSSSLCVAFAAQDAVASSQPTGPARAWTSFLADALPCDPATPCRAELIQALDSRGLETLDTAPQGTGTVISDPTLSGDTLGWTHSGAPQRASLS